MLPTKAELRQFSNRPIESDLEKKIAALQLKYDRDLDQVFVDLQKKVDAIEVAPAAATPEPTTAPLEPIILPDEPEASSPARQSAPGSVEPQSSEPSSTSGTEPPPQAPTTSVPSKKQNLPRWRQTWQHGGLKGLAKRIWTGERDPYVWKRSNESIKSQLTLQEYLQVSEAVSVAVDYYFVIEEAVSPEITKAFEDAKKQIKDLFKKSIQDAHRLGRDLGDLIATTRYMHPPKQQSLPFEKEGENKPGQKKTPEISPPAKVPHKIAIPEAEKRLEDLVAAKMPQARFNELQKYKPWTWFHWVTKPSPKWKIKALQDNKINPQSTDEEILLQQWKDQAGRKFTNNLAGLTNMFLSFHNEFFGDVDYTNDAAIRRKISDLMQTKVEGLPPWKTFLALGKFADEKDAISYLANESTNRKLLNRKEVAKESSTSGHVLDAPEGPAELLPSSRTQWNPSTSSAFGI